jgi:hypothetical protein
MRVMFDAMITDRLLAEPDVLDLVKLKMSDGSLTILITHIQRDQNARASEGKRQQLSEIISLFEVLPTPAAVWGILNYGEAMWGALEDNERVAGLTEGNPKHADDSLITTAAEKNATALVTDDQRLRNRAKRAETKLALWSFDEFRSRLVNQA